MGPTPRDLAARFWPYVGVGHRSECWPWLGAKTGYGYGVVRLNQPRRIEGAHRVAWQLEHGSIPPGMHILHTCDNPPCCNPWHLILGTRSDNMQDMLRKGRGRAGAPRGIRNASAKLDPDKVSEIRLRYTLGGVTQKLLAEEFGVSQQVVSAIVRDQIWIGL